jgi:hypothetical protein
MWIIGFTSSYVKLSRIPPRGRRSGRMGVKKPGKGSHLLTVRPSTKD